MIYATFQPIPSMPSPANARKPLRMNIHKDIPTDGWTDGQPENIMAPVPKGGGITMIKYKGIPYNILHH